MGRGNFLMRPWFSLYPKSTACRLFLLICHHSWHSSVEYLCKKKCKTNHKYSLLKDPGTMKQGGARNLQLFSCTSIENLWSVTDQLLQEYAIGNLSLTSKKRFQKKYWLLRDKYKCQDNSCRRLFWNYEDIITEWRYTIVPPLHGQLQIPP